jgi:SAM-dependent methyltransferase
MPRARNPLAFNEVPALYDRFRPGYPIGAIDALLELASVPDRGRVLEIGPGTGQLTMPLAVRGYAITALEPGPRLAAFLARKARALPNVEVVQARMEDAALEPASWDLVVSATAFHWVDPEARWAIAANALRPNGALGLLRTDHAMGAQSRAYYEGAAPIYRRLTPDGDEPYQPPPETEIGGFRDEMAASGWFEVVEERQFGWDRRHTSATLIGLLRTYSDHRAIARRRRLALTNELRALIDDELGGSFVDRYVTTLCVGRPIARR